MAQAARKTLPRSLIDNWDFKLFGQGTAARFRGYVSSIDPTTAGLGVMIGGSQNVYKSLLGTIRNRCGLKLRGSEDSTAAGVKSSFEWETSLGATRPMRTVNGKLQVEYDAGSGLEWLDLLSGIASDKMLFSYAPWFSEDLSKDVLLMVHGTHELLMWPGGIGSIASAANTAGICGIARGPNYVVDGSSASGTTAGGIGYVVGDEITIAAGNNDAVLVVDGISAATAIATVSVNAGGASYTVGDKVKVGSATDDFAVLEVTSVLAGVVTGLKILANGLGYAAGGYSTENILTSGAPSGLTVTVNSVGSTISQWHYKNNGSGYSVATNVATTGGTGTGATVDIEQVLTGRVTISGSYSAAQLGFDGQLVSSDSSNSEMGGTVVINGTEYTYTALGDDGFSFIGMGDVSSVSPGDGAIAAVVVNTETSSGNTFELVFGASYTLDWINVVGNQPYIGCYTERIVYISSDTNYLNFRVPSFRSPGDPDILTLDSSSRGATSKTGQKGNAVVFGSQGDSYSLIRQIETFITASGGTAFVYETVVIDKSTSSDLSSPLGQDFIGSIGDTIIFLDQNNQLRQYGTLRNLATPVYPFLSLDVYQELANLDFTGGALRTVAEQSGETVYITAPASGALYIYQIRYRVDELGNMGAERLWQPPFLVNAARIAVIEGVTYVYSNANPQLYQMWDTGQYSDDSPSGEPIAYESHAVFAYMSLDDRVQQMKFDKTYFEGYMSPGSTLYCGVYEEYQGALANPVLTINKADDPGKRLAKFYTGVTAPSLGDVSLGQIPLGEGVTGRAASTLPKFRAIRYVTPADMFECALDVFSIDLDSQWELLCLGANMQSTPGRATTLSR